MSRSPVPPDALASARGDIPCDLLLTGGKIFSTATREWVEADLAITDGRVVGWGPREAREIVDVTDMYLVPGFIDAHMHLESTKLWVDEFVRAVLPLGTTAVVADPHEIANVFGLPGIRALVEAATGLPFTFSIVASSCVPASPFESPGAELGPSAVQAVIEDLGAIGVAEVMNYPGVIGGDPDVAAKIATAGWRRVDGHAPGVTGRQLDAYLSAGVESDHECTTFEEAHEKRRKGMWIFIREGSASRNLQDLIKTVLIGGVDRVALCTDDREPSTLLGKGHINDCVRMAVAAGVSAEDAIVLATSNPAQYHNLFDLGSLGPGYQADVQVLGNLVDFRPELVFQRGKLVARDGHLVADSVAAHPAPDWMRTSVHLGSEILPAELELELDPESTYRVIEVIERSLSTRDLKLKGSDLAGCARIAVAERHRRTGRIGIGLVRGFGLTRGAIASTVAHDAHNLMLVGSMDEGGSRDMAVAADALAKAGGGQVAVLDGRILALVPLPVGGLMSAAPALQVARELEELERAAREQLGIAHSAPFMTLSFLGLSVIPELRITDLGLIDVVRFEVAPLAT
ncbi:MAG: adenine deaminase [Actinomycetota bacterium]|nr:adenine deaminase [Actinomycetota bacterium]